MKAFAIVLLAFVATVSATPRKYHYVSTLEFEDEFRGISDREMHPEPEFQFEQKYAQYKNGKAAEGEATSEYWLNKAKSFVEEQVKREPNMKQAKNVIMFLGDGMSHPTIAAARVAMGGEAEKLSFESLPYTASSKTYCVDVQVADSACTATAYLSGVKNNDGMIGLSARAFRANCADGQDLSKRTSSIASWAMAAGKDAGFVTTTRVTHASPAGVYAHIADRDWENDFLVAQNSCNPNVVEDIAEQLIHGEVGTKLKVMMGGGSRNFVDSSMMENGAPGFRSDGKNLINEWMTADPQRTFVNNKQKLMDLNPADVKQVLGLFDTSHIKYNLDIQRDNLQNDIPSLTNMTLKAIDILATNENGYFLFVEGGRIDHGHHDTEAKYAIDETVEFSNAIQAVLDKVNLEETLIVVTADHGHVLSLAGYAPRGNDIFGMAGTGTDSIPYMTLSYANGMGYYNHRNTVEGGRLNPNLMDRSANNFKFPATLPRFSETHGGEDVGIWAVGPWAHLYQGTVEQNVIPHVMAYASCIGNGMTMCQE